MEEGFEYIALSIGGTIIVLFALTFGIWGFNKGLEYNSYLVKDTQVKSSARYNLYYEGDTLYMTPTEAYFDILAVDAFTNVEVDGSLLNQSVLDKARNGETYATQSLKAVLNKTKYHRVTGYDADGNVTYINFIGD